MKKNSVFGRKISRPLSGRQRKLLDTSFNYFRYLKDDSFFSTYQKYILEIGFGDGEFLIQQVIQNENTGFIGCECFKTGITKVVDYFVDEVGKKPSANNLRIFDDNAYFLLNILPKYSLDKIFILFPDPWPKMRHLKRRIIQIEFLKMCHDALKIGGMLYIASDVENYCDSIYEKLIELNYLFDIISIEPPPVTKYHRKAILEKRKSLMYVCLSKNKI
jgi:tRNA (guanine-N7-)-methyltransferase